MIRSYLKLRQHIRLLTAVGIFCLVLLPAVAQDSVSIHVLSIGVDNGGSSYAFTDAGRLPKILTRHIPASMYEVETVYSQVLGSGSRESIEAWFNINKNTIGPEDLFVFFFSGMSTSSNDSLNTVEFKLSNELRNEAHYFSFTELMAWTDLLPAENQLLILEAGDNKPLAALIEEYLLNQDPVENMLSKRNRIFITTNGYSQESNEIESGFMVYLLDNFNTLDQLTNRLIVRKNGISVFDLFNSPFRSEVNYEFDRIVATGKVRPLNKPYQVIYFEDDIRDYLNRAKEWFISTDTLGMRGAIPTGTLRKPEKYPHFSRYALVIGIDEYESEAWPDLVNPVNDARTIHAILSDTYGFESQLLTNPTKEDLLTKLLEYQEVITDTTSQFFFFFAGHGDYAKPFEGTLVTRNTLSPQDDPLRSSYITHANLRNYLNYVPAKHVMVVLDACFGGTFDQSLAESGARAGSFDLYADAEKGEFVRRKMTYMTRKYLTSGGKEYVPDGRKGFHSPFARKLIEAFREQGGEDGILTLNELKSYLEKVTPEPRSGEFGSNEPGSDFLFISQ